MKKSLIIILNILCCGMVMADGVTPPPPPAPECHKIVYGKWNDFLFVDNGDGQYIAYQWYRDGAAIPGETNQYLYHEGVVLQGDGHIYYVVVTQSGGQQVMSCECAFENFPKSVELNPGTVRKAVLYSALGRKVGEWNTRPNSVPGVKGVFVWQLTDMNGNTWTERVVY